MWREWRREGERWRQQTCLHWIPEKEIWVKKNILWHNVTVTWKKPCKLAISTPSNRSYFLNLKFHFRAPQLQFFFQRQISLSGLLYPIQNASIIFQCLRQVRFLFSRWQHITFLLPESNMDSLKGLDLQLHMTSSKEQSPNQPSCKLPNIWNSVFMNKCI